MISKNKIQKIYLVLSLIGWCALLFHKNIQAAWIREETAPYHYEDVWYPDETEKFYYTTRTRTIEERWEEARRMESAGHNVAFYWRSPPEEEQSTDTPTTEKTESDLNPIASSSPAAPPCETPLSVDASDFISKKLIGRKGIFTYKNGAVEKNAEIFSVPSPVQRRYFIAEVGGRKVAIYLSNLEKLEIFP